MDEIAEEAAQALHDEKQKLRADLAAALARAERVEGERDEANRLLHGAHAANEALGAKAIATRTRLRDLAVATGEAAGWLEADLAASLEAEEAISEEVVRAVAQRLRACLRAAEDGGER